MICAKFDWNWPSCSGEGDFLNLSVYFHNFVIISLWKKAGPFIWTNLNPLHPVPNLVEIGPVVLEKKVKSVRQWWQWIERQQQQQRGRQTMDKFWSEKLTSCELKSYGQDTKKCQKLYKFDLEVKVQGRMWIMNVCNTSSHCDSPMCQIW